MRISGKVNSKNSNERSLVEKDIEAEKPIINPCILAYTLGTMQVLIFKLVESGIISKPEFND